MAGSILRLTARPHTPDLVPVRPREFAQDAAVLSPSGEWLAYRSNQSGQSEVYVQPYPGPGPTVPVSIGGGVAPTWSSDGSELSFATFSGSGVLGVTVTTSGDQIQVGLPRELLPAGYFLSLGREHDLGRDGRFLMLSPEGQTTANVDRLTQVVLVQNWFQELTERVPVP